MTDKNTMPDVSIVGCDNYSEETVKAAYDELFASLDALSWVKSGMTVGIKANLVTFKHPEAAATVHPTLLAELTRRLIALGARVIIGDSPGGAYSVKALSMVYSFTGMQEAEAAGAVLNRNVETREAECIDGMVLRRFPYTAWLDEVDAIIGFSKLKTHGMMGMSGAVKNMFGVIPGVIKPEFHYRFPNQTDFANMLIDLNEHFKPRLYIMDAVVGMEGNGPTAGKPKKIGALMASFSPYKLDAAAAEIIGLDGKSVLTVKAAAERGLSPESAKELSLYGEISPYRVPDFELLPTKSVDNLGEFLIVNKFIQANLVAVPKVKASECISCGKCEDMCPAHAITLRATTLRTKTLTGGHKTPHFDRKRCIRCFCCQEFCPKGALKVKRPLLARLFTKV